MIFEQVPTGGCQSYLIGCPATLCAALIDPERSQVDRYRALAAQKGGPTKKVLFFTKSGGFPHSVVTRKDGKPALAERVLTEIGKEHGFEVVASKDGRMFDPDKIGQWDAFAFQTTGDLTTAGTDKNPPMSKDGKKASFAVTTRPSPSSVSHAKFSRLNATQVAVRMDSKLVIEQMSGRWQIKNPGLRPLAAEAATLVGRVRDGVTFEWIPRERNKTADALANQAMDEATGKPTRARTTPSASTKTRRATPKRGLLTGSSITRLDISVCATCAVMVTSRPITPT